MICDTIGEEEIYEASKNFSNNYVDDFVYS